MRSKQEPFSSTTPHLHSSSIHFNSEPVSSRLNSPQSCYQMMEHMLQGLNDSKVKSQSLQQQQKWGELLTNRYKMQAYKKQVGKVILKNNKEIGSHLKLLLFLLEQIQQSEVSVTLGSGELSLKFGSLHYQQDLRKLQQENYQKDKEKKDTVLQYQKMLLKFNGVIEHLVQKQSRLQTHRNQQ